MDRSYKALYFGAMSLLATTAFAAHINPTIVGGDQVSDLNEVPFIVQLHDGQGVECGGTVIAPKWVLSAAHCAEVVSGITLLGGSLVSGQGETLAIKTHFVHPQYKENAQSGPSNDFMLIELAQPINFAKSAIKQATLPDADFVSRGLQNPGAMMTVAGWGDLGENAGNYPSQLYSVEVPVVDQKTANAATEYNGALDDTMIAAGYPKGGKDSCDGDSGGPLFTYDTQKAQNVLVGVVSWGKGCAQASMPGVYSKVTAGLDWIKSTMQANP